MGAAAFTIQTIHPTASLPVIESDPKSFPSSQTASLVNVPELWRLFFRSKPGLLSQRKAQSLPAVISIAQMNSIRFGDNEDVYLGVCVPEKDVAVHKH